MRSAPLLLLSKQEKHALSESLQDGIAGYGDLFFMKPDHSGERFEVNYCGARFLCEITQSDGNHVGLKQIMLNADFPAVRSAIELNFSATVATDPPVLPIVTGLLSVGAKLAEFLELSAVVWRPAKLASGPDFFIRSIGSFASGGAFPALSLVRFINEGAGAIRTSGLSWFSGQEIEFEMSGLDEKAAMRRIVRVVHDIAVNGPVVEEVEVGGLEPNEKLHISLSAGRSLVRVGISSNTDL